MDMPSTHTLPPQIVEEVQDIRTIRPLPIQKKKILGVSFANREIAYETEARIETGPHTYYNAYYGHSWILHAPGSSYVRISFETSSEDAAAPAQLKLSHLSSYVNGQWYSPVCITINGKVFLEHYVPNSADWVYDHFDISSYLKEGQNEVRIDFLPGAIGNYWLNYIGIERM
jgi:hypothetical protein